MLCIEISYTCLFAKSPYRFILKSVDTMTAKLVVKCDSDFFPQCSDHSFFFQNTARTLTNLEYLQWLYEYSDLVKAFVRFAPKLEAIVINDAFCHLKNWIKSDRHCQMHEHLPFILKSILIWHKNGLLTRKFGASLKLDGSNQEQRLLRLTDKNYRRQNNTSRSKCKIFTFGQ